MIQTYKPAVVEAGNDALVAELTDLTNRAYDVAEKGLWKEGVARTTSSETAEGIVRQEILVAREAGRIVGVVRTRCLDRPVGWFGALAVDERNAGRGIGGIFVAAAEGGASQAGASLMQLELLVPATAHPHTERLARWYTRLGYRRTGSCELAEVDPAAVPFLRQACDVAIMQKDFGHALA